MSVVTTKMIESDISMILKIQSDNLRENLTPSQQKDGFLSIAFSENEFRDFNNNICVVVAKEQNDVIGFCCFSSAKFNAQFPILDQIVANLSSYSIPGTQDMPTKDKTCFYGPACISKFYRGKGVLTKLFSYGLEIAKEIGNSYCFSFISSENARSLNAHMKLPLNQVGKVNNNQNDYWVMACKV